VGEKPERLTRMGRIEPKAAKTADGRAFWVRSAEPGDAPAMVVLNEHMHENNLFKLTERGEMDRDGPQEAEWIAEHLANPYHLMLVAADAPEIGVGTLLGRIAFRNGNRRKLAHHGTFGIGVRADWRGTGVGTALIAGLLDWAAASPAIEKVCLGYFARNVGAGALYRRMGFVQEGVSARHFKIGPGLYDDDVTMAMFVKPGVAPDGFGTWPSAPSEPGARATGL
jgi:RimJ/RimL family protein N-acetyltransferase